MLEWQQTNGDPLLCKRPVIPWKLIAYFYPGGVYNYHSNKALDQK